MNQSFVEALEHRALMAATVVRDVVPFDFSGPSQLVLKAEPIDLSVTGTDVITTVTTDRRTHTGIKETSVGSGTGLDSGAEYTYEAKARVVDNHSASGAGVTQLVIHSELTTADGGTIRELYVAHYMVGQDGQLRYFEKVV